MATVIKGSDYELGNKLKRVVQKLLHNELCEVRFIKADESKRIMVCSLLPTFLPPEDYDGPSYETMVKKINNPYLITVWDIENAGWRSFTLERFLRLTVIE